MQKIIKTYMYRLEPTPEQEQVFYSYCGANRYVYNWALSRSKVAFEKKEKIPNYFDNARDFTQLKRQEDHKWLENVNVATIQHKLKDLDRSIKHFFRELKKKSGVGFPRFRKRGINDSFRYPAGVKVSSKATSTSQKLEPKFEKVFLPCIGWVRYRNSRPIYGAIKQTTVKRVIDKWFITIVTEQSQQVLKSSIIQSQVQDNTCQSQCIDKSQSEGLQSQLSQSSVGIAYGIADLIEHMPPIEKKKKGKKKKAKLEDVEANDVLQANVNILQSQPKVINSQEANNSQGAEFLSQSDKQSQPILPNVPLLRTSDGQIIDNPDYLAKDLAKIKKRQKKLARCKQDSKRWKKASDKLAKAHLKVKNRRKDFLHKVSTDLVRNYDIITIEDIDLKNIRMAPEYSKIVADTGWHALSLMLGYKALWYGKELIKITSLASRDDSIAERIRAAGLVVHEGNLKMLVEDEQSDESRKTLSVEPMNLDQKPI